MSAGFPGSAGSPGPAPNYGPYAGAPKNASGGLMAGAFGTPQTMAGASGVTPGGSMAGRINVPAYGPMTAPQNQPAFQQIGGVPGATTLGTYQAGLPKPAMTPAPLTAGQAPRVAGPVAPTPMPGVLPASVIRTPTAMLPPPKVAARR